MEINHYVYKIIHIQSGDYYIGVRSCKGEIAEDSYFGSGADWNKLYLKKYPREDFDKIILGIYPSRKEADRAEVIFLKGKYGVDPFCMNQKGGGQGGNFTEEMKIAVSMRYDDPQYAHNFSGALREKWKDPDYRAPHVERMKKRWENPEYRARMEESRKTLENRRTFTLAGAGLSEEELLVLVDLVFTFDEQGFSPKEISEILEKGSAEWVRHVLEGKTYAVFTEDLRAQRELRRKQRNSTSSD